jgi:FixJ family two-component response regulator
VVAVIDDDKPVCTALARLLRSVGLGAVTFGSAPDFLGSCDPVDCLIVDIDLPTMTGTELQQVLLETRRAVPTVFITGSTEIGLEETCLARGACAFLRKPFSEEALLEALSRALPDWLATVPPV